MIILIVIIVIIITIDNDNNIINNINNNNNKSNLKENIKKSRRQTDLHLRFLPFLGLFGPPKVTLCSSENSQRPAMLQGMALVGDPSLGFWGKSPAFKKETRKNSPFKGRNHKAFEAKLL